MNGRKYNTKEPSLCVILGIAILTSLIPSAFAEGTEEDYCGCFESQELAEAVVGALIQRRLEEIPTIYQAAPYRVRPGREASAIMPSVGEVHMLVLPIAYSDHPDTLKNYYDAETYETKMFFNEYDPSLSVYDQSVRGYYQWASNGKLDITGTILPVYTAPEPGAYYEKNPLEFGDMIGDALDYYVDSGLDLSEFDNDGDKVVDALVVHSLANPSSSSDVVTGGVWRDIIRTLNKREIGNCLVHTYAHTTRRNASLQGARNTINHEIGHLLGMSDHYKQSSDCYLDYELKEIMGASGLYINAYYKILFDWIEPIILTNEDSVGRIELTPVEKYVSRDAENKTAVILIPDATNIPFTEFYIAEYRAGGAEALGRSVIFEDSPGIVIWHCNTYYNPQLIIKPHYEKDWLKPVYKSGTETYGEKDIYVAGDEFSSDSAVNSNFYNGDYTGAYLRVEEITPEKAVLQAGFREPNLGPAPVIRISKPTPSAIRGTEKATFTITVTDGTNVISHEHNREWERYHFYTTGTLLGTEFQYWSRNPTPVEITDLDGTKGEGTIWVDIPPGAVQYNAKDSNPAKSEVVYIDNTPPKITLKGENPQRIPQGSAYKELGAVASDNLDPDIESKLKINATQVKTDTPGTYTVTYSVTDHVRYTTTARRTVIVEPHVHQYSDEWKSDGTSHWHECSCGDKADFAEHTAEIDPGEEATCTQPGKTKGSHCSVCERVLQAQTVIQPLGHDYSSQWSQDETNHWHECSRCQEKKDLAPHTEGGGTVTKQPTEEETGIRTFSCVECSRMMRTETIPKLEPSHTHEYSEDWKSDGTSHWHECECGDRDDMTAHTLEPIPGKEATCTRSGLTAGSRCSICGRILVAQTEIPAKGHTLSESWSSDTTGHWHECTVCHAEVDRAFHTEDSGTVTKEPTLEETGLKVYSCSACSYEMRTEILDKLEPSHTHEYSEDWKSDGSDHWHECECGDRADIAVHTPETIPGKEATCTQLGLTEGSRCSVCGRILVAQTEISPKGHSYPDAWANDDANHWRECSTCHEKADTSVHTWDGGVITTVPTSSKAGVRTYTCTVCKQTRTETIPATGGGGSGGGSSGSSGGSTVTREPEYAVTLPQKTEGGSIKAEPQKAVKGSKVTLTVEIAEGYELEELTVKDKKGNELTLEEKAGKYTFSMPASDIEVTVLFRELPKEEPKEEPAPPPEKEPDPIVLPFTDVPEKAWYYDAVAEVYDKGLMTGVTKTEFAPELPASRGMVVTMLYRMAGEPPIRGKTAFTDISGKEYYAQAVAWATVQGLVTGYGDGTFRPNEEISREQLVTILYRYAERKGHDMTQRADLSGFFDEGQISAYAREAMSWAKAEGLVNGADWGGIDPRGATGRGQVATILSRL